LTTLAASQVAYDLLNSATRGFRCASVLVRAAAGGMGTALALGASVAINSGSHSGC